MVLSVFLILGVLMFLTHQPRDLNEFNTAEKCKEKMQSHSGGTGTILAASIARTRSWSTFIA